MNLLKKLRMNRKLINNSKNQLSIQMSPGIYRIDTQKCYTLNLSKQEKKNLKIFVKKFLFSFLLLFFLKNILNTKIKTFILV